MSTFNYTSSPVVEYSVDSPGEKGGDTVSVVWNLTQMRGRQVPFESLDEDKLEHIVEMGDDDGTGTSGGGGGTVIRIRFGLKKTQYLQPGGAQKLNYLSLYATALSAGAGGGGRESLECCVWLHNLNANLAVLGYPLLSDAVVQLKSRGDGGEQRKVLFKQLLHYSTYMDPYHRENSEDFNNNTAYPSNKQYPISRCNQGGDAGGDYVYRRYVPPHSYHPTKACTESDSNCLIYGITVTLLRRRREANQQQPIPPMCPGPVSSTHDELSFAKSLQAMYESEESFSDVKLESKDYMILNAHKFILAARSPILRRMLAKQRGGKEEDVVAEAKLKFDNINGKPLRAILHWMYTNSLDEAADKVIPEVFEGAKILQLTGLLELMDTKLITICNPRNMMTLFTAALECKMKTAVKDIRQYIKENIEDPSLDV